MMLNRTRAGLIVQFLVRVVTSITNFEVTYKPM